MIGYPSERRDCPCVRHPTPDLRPAFPVSLGFALAGRLTLFGPPCLTLRGAKRWRSNRKPCLFAQKESKQRNKAPCITVDGKKRHRVNSGRHAPRPKGRPCGRSKRLSCRFVIRASQVTAREKLTFGSNSFPLNPLLAPVLSGAEGRLAAGSVLVKTIVIVR